MNATLGCAATTSRLAPYAERLLNGAESAAVATHLLTCRACRHRFEAVNHSLGWVSQWPQPIESPLSWEEFAIGLDSIAAPASSRSFIQQLSAAWQAVVSPLRWHGVALVGFTAALALAVGFSNKVQPIDVAAVAAHNAWSLQAPLRSSEAAADRTGPIKRTGELAIMNWATEGVSMAAATPAPQSTSHACTVCHFAPPDPTVFAETLL